MTFEEALLVRKQPRQQRAQVTVDSIFAAAVQLLERNDGEPSVQAIADHAGVSIGSLYQYFPSKAALARAVIGFYQRRAVATIEEWLAGASGLTGEEAAHQLVDMLLGTKKKRLKVELELIRYFCRVGDVAALTTHDNQLNAAIERFIAQLGPQVRPVDPRIAAFLISNCLRSAVVISAIQRPEQLHDPQFKEELVRMIVSYLKA